MACYSLIGNFTKYYKNKNEQINTKIDIFFTPASECFC